MKRPLDNISATMVTWEQLGGDRVAVTAADFGAASPQLVLKPSPTVGSLASPLGP